MGDDVLELQFSGGGLTVTKDDNLTAKSNVSIRSMQMDTRIQHGKVIRGADSAPFTGSKYTWHSKKSRLYPTFFDLAPAARTLSLTILFGIIFAIRFIFSDVGDLDRGSRWAYASIFCGIWSLWRLMAVVVGSARVPTITRSGYDVLEEFEYVPEGREGMDDIDWAFPSSEERHLIDEQEREWSRQSQESLPELLAHTSTGELGLTTQFMVRGTPEDRWERIPPEALLGSTQKPRKSQLKQPSRPAATKNPFQIQVWETETTEMSPFQQNLLHPSSRPDKGAK